MTDKPVTATPAAFIARVGDLLQLLEGVSGESGKAAELVSVAAELRAMLATTGAPLQLPLDEHTREILGRANYHHGRLAHMLRDDGHEIADDPVHEQAAVMTYLLNTYLRHGGDLWWQEVDAHRERVHATRAADAETSAEPAASA